MGGPEPVVDTGLNVGPFVAEPPESMFVPLRGRERMATDVYASYGKATIPTGPAGCCAVQSPSPPHVTVWLRLPGVPARFPPIEQLAQGSRQRSLGAESVSTPVESASAEMGKGLCSSKSFSG